MSSSKATTWRDARYAEISTQLKAFNTIAETNFDGQILKKESPNGAWLLRWLGRVYDQHSDSARLTATITVLEPGSEEAGPSAGGSNFKLLLEATVRRHLTRSTALFPEAFEAPIELGEEDAEGDTDEEVVGGSKEPETGGGVGGEEAAKGDAGEGAAGGA